MASEGTPIDASDQDDVFTGAFSEDPAVGRYIVDYVPANDDFWLPPTEEDTSNVEPNRRSSASNTYPQRNDNTRYSPLYGSSTSNNTLNSSTSAAPRMESTMQHAGNHQETGYGDFISMSNPSASGSITYLRRNDNTQQSPPHGSSTSHNTMNSSTTAAIHMSSRSYPSVTNVDSLVNNVTHALRPVDTGNDAATELSAPVQQTFPFNETVPNLDYRRQQPRLCPLRASLQNDDMQYIHNPTGRSAYSNELPQLTGVEISPLYYSNLNAQPYRIPIDHSRVAMFATPPGQSQIPMTAYPIYPSTSPSTRSSQMGAANQSIGPQTGIGTVEAITQVSTSEDAALEDCKQPASSESNKSLSVPVRPLSAYNYFFRFERERLLKYSHFGDEVPKKLPSHYYDHYELTVVNSNEFQRQLLEEQWSRDANAKRKHCKTHGRVSFRDLAKRIAKNWHDLPKPTQDVFREVSKQDHQPYLREIQLYNKNAKERKSDETRTR